MRSAIAAAASATASEALNALAESDLNCVALKAATGAGGSLALRETASRLSDEGMTPIVVAPPPRQLDTAALALGDVAASLSALGLASVNVQTWLEPHTWWERLRLVRTWIAEAAGSKGVVLLVDDPSQWAIPNTNEIAWRVQSVLDVVLADSTPIPRVVVRTDGRDHSGETSVPCHQVTGLLEDEADWGDALSPVVADLRETLPEIATASPVAVGLAVGLAAVTSPERLVRSWSPGTATSRIADELANAVSQERRLLPLWASWLSSAMPRRRVPNEWMSDFARPILANEVLQAVLDRCLLTRDDETALVREARAASWRIREDEFVTHVRSAAASPLYRRYVEAMDQAMEIESFDSCRFAAEALNLTRRVPDARSVEAVPVPFSDHLNNVGAASLEASEWTNAASAFALALEQDPEDAFALHYLGFSLDNEAKEPRRVERNYVQALERDSTHVTWHERLVSFLVVQARVSDASKRFETSRVQLLPDDGDASVEVYAQLHLPIAANLLRRAELPLTAHVLRTIPRWAHERLAGLRSQRHRLEVLEAATEKPLCVPADRVMEKWWKQPELLGERDDGLPLQVWLAATVEAISSNGIDLHAAVIEGEQRSFGTTTISWETLQARAEDETRLEELDVGDFLEIGYYGRGAEISNDPVIRILQRRDWTSGIETPLDPMRYILQSFPSSRAFRELTPEHSAAD